MRAQVIREFGVPDVFEWLEKPTPEPGIGQVLLKVHAVSVNPVDIKIRNGDAPLGPPMPATLGCDVAGVVEAVGPGGGRFRVGDQVFGCVGGVGAHPGTYATHVVADARLLALMPEGASFREAAALPLVTITAAEGLDDKARVQPGQHVLVFGGTGGVGHVAVQWAAARGAVVHTTASSQSKAEIARGLGAAEVHDHRAVEAEAWAALAPGGKGYDVVFDTVGGANLDVAFQAARLNGVVISTSTVGPSDLTPVHLKSLTLSTVFMLIPLLHGHGLDRHGQILDEAAHLFERRLLRPLIDPQHFALDGISTAHEFLESGRAVGKVVVQVVPEPASSPGAA